MGKSNANVKTEASFGKAAQRILKASKNIGDTAPQGIRMIGEEIMTDVKSSRVGHGVPVKYGALRASGKVEGPRGDAKNVYVLLSFGGTAAGYNMEVGYALIQHEVLTFRHRVGEARYLVRGIERWSPTKSAAMAAWKANAQAGVKAAAGK